MKFQPSAFEDALERVLSPDGLYWHYPGDDTDDAERRRMVEVRLDVPTSAVTLAKAEMERDGWTLNSRPDDASDPVERLYFCKEQSLCRDAKIAMLTTSLRAAYEGEGTFWSWINVENKVADPI